LYKFEFFWPSGSWEKGFLAGLHKVQEDYRMVYAGQVSILV
jgi:hypothetical protein